MGKQMSKVGSLRTNTRRQRSQVLPSPTVVSPPLPPRVAPESTDRAILTLKLQRDELTVYKGNINNMIRTENEILKNLLKDGKFELAKILLQKKRFQEHLLQDIETQLNSYLGQSNLQAQLATIRNEVEKSIEKNTETMKRLKKVVSVENPEWILETTYEGTKKQQEVLQVLLLATMAEREILDKYADAELAKLATTLGITSDQLPTELADITEEEPAAEHSTNEAEENELEVLAADKLKEREEEQKLDSEDGEPLVAKPDEVTSEITENPEEVSVAQNSLSNTAVYSISEITTADGDDQKNYGSTSPSTTPLVKLLPDVPTHSIGGVRAEENEVGMEEESEKPRQTEVEADNA